MRHPRQIIANLQDSEQRFNLRHYERDMVSVKMGSVVFNFTQDQQRFPEVSVEPHELGPANVMLVNGVTGIEPGSRIIFGRNSGIDVINPGDQRGENKLRELGGSALAKALIDIDDLSRMHARIAVIDPWTLSVKDLNSTNKTMVLGNRRSREDLRRMIHVVG